MTTCPNCGKEAGESKFCPDCGKPLSVEKPDSKDHYGRFIMLTILASALSCFLFLIFRSKNNLVNLGVLVGITLVAASIFFIVTYIFNVLMIIDAAQRKDTTWTILLVFSMFTGVLPFLFAWIYYSSKYNGVSKAVQLMISLMKELFVVLIAVLSVLVLNLLLQFH